MSRKFMIYKFSSLCTNKHTKFFFSRNVRKVLNAVDETYMKLLEWTDVVSHPSVGNLPHDSLRSLDLPVDEAV